MCDRPAEWATAKAAGGSAETTTEPRKPPVNSTTDHPRMRVMLSLTTLFKVLAQVVGAFPWPPRAILDARVAEEPLPRQTLPQY